MNIKNFIIKQKKFFITIFITIFIEIFICNFPFFRTITLGNTNLKPEYTQSTNYISITNINTRITSIKINYKNKSKDKITYDLSYTAEANSDIVYLNKKTIVNNNHYINFDTHSKCKNINLYLTTDNQNLEIDSIILNHPNLNISIIRILIIFIFIIFIIKIKDKSIYTKEYNKDSKYQNNNFKINLFMFCSFIVIYIFCQYAPQNIFIEKENINKEEHAFLMQTEAILNGQMHLIEEPSKELLEMEHPYDSTLRDSLGIKYLYDVAYYKGKYYSYFGIAPILTSILPFRLITGKYTYTFIFNLIYLFISIISLYSLYKKLIDKYIKKISLFNYYLGFYTIIFASNIFTLLRGLKYDIVTTSGIAFLLISLNLALSINNNPKYKKLKLILLGITTALIVLSKPNLIIYYFLILFFITISFKKYNIKEKIKSYSLILIPLSIFAILQMFLNYIRFDSIFEFGAKYQLTSINVTTHMGITFGKIYTGLMEYIFKTPIINPLKFPFIFMNTNTSILYINEICYAQKVIGLISIPILYIFFLKGNIITKENNKELKSLINISLILTLISIIIITCFGGIAEPYSIDHKLILSLSAIILSFKWIEQNKENDTINKIFLTLCISTILIMIPISLNTEANFLINQSSHLSHIIKNLFEFWA